MFKTQTRTTRVLLRGETHIGHGISTIDRMCTNTGACPVLELLEFRVACLAALNFSEGITS